MTTIHNREAFLAHLHKQLGTSPEDTEVHPFVPKNDLPHTQLADKTTEELIGICEEKLKDIHTNLVRTTSENLNEVLTGLIKDFEGGNILLPTDTRFDNGTQAFLEETYGEAVSVWEPGVENRESNIKKAEQANIAIAHAEFLLAESGSIVVETTAGQGRSLHFLPKHYISLVPKSKIVPRSTQAADFYANKITKGEETGSAIHFISGPSNSGDIEMQLVVGLHGPLKVIYVILDDL